MAPILTYLVFVPDQFSNKSLFKKCKREMQKKVPIKVILSNIYGNKELHS